jgi:hypothetical protein
MQECFNDLETLSWRSIDVRDDAPKTNLNEFFFQ